MMAAAQLDGIRTVRQAARGLTLACTEYVGPLSMAMSLGTVAALAEPLPRRLRRDIEAIDKGEKKQ